ncbi:MAG: branched-chain amino acid ABC transporter permease [Acidisphaera sp.]|nr:branched-chain amino acid ABC transporter permease [Acidisphaera sp.]MBV9813164.1 branched-chain amino acid ABC transporter permease [Acetobacteraceae bacterium]
MIGWLSYGCFFASVALTYAVATLGLNLQWGSAGLFNVGVAGFAAVGAYAAAFATAAPSASHWGGFGLPIAVGWLAAMAAAAAAAALVGAITLRLRADYLAITTFGAAVSIQLVLLNAQRVTGGPFGIAFIPKPFERLAAAPLAFAVANLALLAAVASFAYWALERLTRSPWGRVLRALREDEAAAASLGKNPDRFRLQAFVIGAALIGLAGAMQAQFFGFIAPDNYLPVFTFQVWVMLVLGGSGNNRGAVAGAVAVWALWALSGTALAALLPQAWQARGAALRVVGIGVVLALVLLVRPRGLFGEPATVSRHLRP